MVLCVGDIVAMADACQNIIPVAVVWTPVDHLLTTYVQQQYLFNT